MGKTAQYILEMIESRLGSAEKEKRFPWACGDVSAKTNRACMLPFDGVWEQHKLIVEVHEDQHRKPNKLFDKPHKMTCSGVHRGEQRRIYDARKKAAAETNGYHVLVVEWRRNRRRHPDDIDEVWSLLIDSVPELSNRSHH